MITGNLLTKPDNGRWGWGVDNLQLTSIPSRDTINSSGHLMVQKQG